MIREEGHQHKNIIDLIQLQELCATRLEQKTARPGSRLKPLDEAIAGMEKSLPEDLKRTFAKLMARNGLAIVPISVASCSACGMGLPISLVNTVKVADTIQACPNCTRLLFYPEGFPRGIPKSKKSGAPAVGILRFSAPELMVPNLPNGSPEEIIGHMATLMQENGFVDDGKVLTQAALQRESVMSTGMDHGLAFPHVRGIEGGGITLALGINKKGIKFGAPANRLTRIFFFMVIPTAASVFYLKLLSGLTETFRDTEARDALLKAKTEKELWKALVQTKKKSLK